jgi:hypothetical protein
MMNFGAKVKMKTQNEIGLKLKYHYPLVFNSMRYVNRAYKKTLSQKREGVLMDRLSIKWRLFCIMGIYKFFYNKINVLLTIVSNR